MIEKSLVIGLVSLALVAVLSTVGVTLNDTMVVIANAFNGEECRGLGIWKCEPIFGNR